MNNDLNVNKIKPLGSNILVQCEGKQEQDYVLGDIILPESACSMNSRYVKAKVIAVGEGKVLDTGERENIEVSVGDCVLIDELLGNEIVIDGHVYHIINACDIFAVVLP